MLVEHLQDLLARLYGLDLAAHVADFLTTDEEVARELLPSQTTLADEMLLLRADDANQTEAGLELSLYLNEALLERVNSSSPHKHLHADNLQDFCTVLEGVSHFVYVVWNAAREKPVTKLELELQAEIDKYMGARLMLEAQQAGALPRSLQQSLLKSLFSAVRYRDDLTKRQARRYRQANHYAQRYCYHLQSRFPAQRVHEQLLFELRGIYRMTQSAKLSHIHAAQFA